MGKFNLRAAVVLMFFMITLALQIDMPAQSTLFSDKGTTVTNEVGWLKYTYTVRLYKTDTCYTYGIDPSGIAVPYVYDLNHYVTYSNDSVRVNYRLQGYYNKTAKWSTIKTLIAQDSLKDVYYTARDTIQYWPDSLRLMIWGGPAVSGSSVANGKGTSVNGVFKFSRK